MKTSRRVGSSLKSFRLTSGGGATASQAMALVIRTPVFSAAPRPRASLCSVNWVLNRRKEHPPLDCTCPGFNTSHRYLGAGQDKLKSCCFKCSWRKPYNWKLEEEETLCPWLKQVWRAVLTLLVMGWGWGEKEPVLVEILQILPLLLNFSAFSWIGVSSLVLGSIPRAFHWFYYFQQFHCISEQVGRSLHALVSEVNLWSSFYLFLIEL